MKAIKKQKREDLKLRNIVKQSMAELRKKDRELQIGSSLEKVRMVAMSMMKPSDMLRICKAIAQQMRSLGIREIRNVQTAVINTHKSTYINFEFYTKHNKLLTTEVDYTDHPMTKAFVKQMLSGPGGFFKRSLKGKKVQEWYKFQRTTNQFVDKYLAKASSLSYYWYSLGPVALGISTYEPLGQEDQELFKRFRNVFELAYRRYLDIEKAEAHAREAQIQLALEKVRARTMAMQKSDELPQTTYVLFQQLRELGETAAQISLGVIKEEEGIVELSATVHGNQMPQRYKVPIDEPYVMKKAMKAWREKHGSIKVEIRGKDLKKYNQWRNSVLEKKIIFSERQWIVNVVFFSNGMLSFSSDKQIPQETLQLLERFAAVFGQTYTRFLDLKKAEAQAREAHVEAALERVRASTMAMHRSEELREVIMVVSEQLKHLNFRFSNVSFIVNNEDYDLHFWSATPFQSYPFELHVPFLDSAAVNNLKEARKKGLDFFTDTLTPEENHQWLHHMVEHSDLKDASDEIKTYLSTRGALARSLVLTKHITLAIGNYLARPYTDEENAILKRFGNVFDQSYTRFLDLHRAEAQAKEAQIEAALEKVRSRSLAMHRSDELREIVAVVFDNLKALGFAMDEGAAIVMIFDEGSKGHVQWIADRTQSYPTAFEIPYSNHTILLDIYRAKERGADLFSKIYSFAEKNSYFRYLFKTTGYQYMPADVRKIILQSKHLSVSVAFEKNSAILISTRLGKLLSNEQNEILKRVAKVFEQSYTRFLDLQKAEAQARESQIQLALERVRARTMAMQRSDELSETAVVLFQQFKELGDDPIQITIGTFNEKENVIEFRITSAEGLGSRIDQVFNASLDEPALIRKIYSAWKANKKSAVIALTGSELIRWIKYRGNISGQYAYDSKIGPGDTRFVAIGLFSKGVISFSKPDPIAEETIQILERFAGVFDLTYTRFLDLKNAEAQAREAKIETALEKVRSRSLAMQKSDELQEVVHTVFERLKELNVDFYTAIIVLFNEGSKDITWWLENKESQQYPRILVPYAEIGYLRGLFEARERGNDLFSMSASFEEKNELFHHLFEHTDLKDVSEKQKKFLFGTEFATMSVALAKNTGIHITSYSKKSFSAEDNEILKRFAKVFDQAYTRFLDLQKAEAQAREAQIETALERVRSRTMAMHKSDELSQTSSVLFQQLKLLGVQANRTGFGIYDEPNQVIQLWLTAASENESEKSVVGSIPFHLHPAVDENYKAWKENKSILVHEFAGEDVRGYYEKISKYLPLEPQKAYPEQLIFSAFFFSEGSLNVLSDRPLSEEERAILLRFANVFGQTYRRYLDLQKAEAQAREAEIELGLERVRARAMAMQTSEELGDLIGTVFTELTRLDLILTRCVILIYEGDDKGVRWWMANSEAPSMPMSFFVKYANMPFFNEYLKAWQDRSLKWQYSLGGENKIKTDDFLFNETGLSQLPDFVIAGMRAPDRVYLNASFNNFGNLTLASLEPLSDEHFDILLRFAKVFDLTYTRFNDLKQAEAQARESQIQLALERVRSRTIAMHQSNELAEAALLLFQQLRDLGLSFIRTGFYIWQRESELVEGWASNGDLDEILPPFLLPFKEDDGHRGIYEASLKGDLIYEQVLSGEALKRHYQWLMSQPTVPKTMRKLNESEYYFQEIQYKYAAIFKEGYLLMIATEPQPDAANLLKRFAKVFEQSYTRFLDLQKAEAQAREAQIELGLERVRARAMAMQKSEELVDLIDTVQKELTRLEFKLNNCILWIMEEQPPGATWWVGPVQRTNLPESYHVPFPDLPYFNALYNAWIKRIPKWVYVLQGDGKYEADQYLFNQTDLIRFPPEVKEDFAETERVYISFSFYNYGGLHISTPDPLAEEQLDVINRFSKVFDMTYTRFLDLKKAEAQAREALIEASLEKVRSSAMAMHNSNDISSTTTVVFVELKKLGIESIRCGVALLSKNSRTAEVYAAASSSDGELKTLRRAIEMTDHPSQRRQYESWLSQKTYVAELTGEELKSYYQLPFFFSSPSYVPPQDYEQSEFGYYIPFSEGLFYAWTKKAYSESELNILDRFKKIIDLTFRRFLDLQKAEAQAREAQIEAALERVRSRAMAMHKSEDLSPAVATVFEELDKLNLGMSRCGIGIIHKERRSANAWITSIGDHGTTVQISGEESMDLHPLLQGVFDAWLKHQDFSYVLEGEDMKNYYRASGMGNVKLPESQLILSGNDLKPQFYHIATFEAGGLFAFRETTFSDEAKTVMKRFANVFNLTYKRFLDIQKAEAQAREAQIEAALERVRSKAMAMHKSEDLHPAVAVVFDELDKLDIGVLRCGISVLNKEKRTGDVWLTSTTDEGSSVQVTGDESFDIHPLLAGAFDAWLRQEDFDYVLEGDDLTEYYKAVKDARFRLPESQFISSEVEFKRQYAHVAVYHAGGLFAFRETEFPDEAKKVMKRFANVFDLTYKRFIDLQKAEAQAREAQIQLALERVRARTMAMQKSDELSETSYVLFEQWKELGQDIDQISIGIFGEDERAMKLYSTLHGKQWKRAARIEYDKHAVYRQIFSAWKENEKSFVADLSGKELSDLNKFKVETADYQIGFEDQLPQDRWIIYVAFFSNGMISLATEQPHPKESLQLLERFASVFDLTYTRFVDLQKAEAQAREAQIEAALERIRSRTMAMHRSQEIADIVGKIFSELSLLDLVLNRVLIWIFNDEERYIRWWSANPEVESNAESYRVDYNDTPVFSNYLQAWQKRLPMYLYTLSGDNKKDWEEYLFNNTELSKLPEAVRKGMREEGTIFTTSTTGDYGLMMVGSFEPLSDANTDIIQRFGRVFQQSYTRYLDVQKAEAQAREAQIEVAMEKVRARAMAMQKAEELVEVAQLLRKEMGSLGVEELETSSIYIHNEQTGTTECWYAIQDVRGQDKKLVADHMTIDLKDTWVGREMLTFYRSDHIETSILMQGENRKEWINYCAMRSKVLQGYYGDVIPERSYHLVKFSDGYMGAASPGDLSAESWALLRRATTVFSLAYTRFSDLKLAEAQAKEATIEAALERVRAKAMAMHNSDDVSAAASMVFTELRKLGINPIRCGVGLLNNETLKAPLYSATSSAHGDSLSLVGWVMLEGHPVLEKIYENWLAGEDYFPELSGESLKSYYGQLLSGLSVPVPDFTDEQKQYGHFFSFSIGCLYAWSDVRYNDDQIRILKRFASIIDLTFRRYMDLQKSEANAREAVKQAALDRIRADIASMRTVSDLDRITPLIWNELTILGLPFIRCGVFLMDESQQLIHTFLSTPDGQAIAAFHIPYDTPGNMQQVLHHWQQKERYCDHWDEEAFIDFANTLVRQGALASPGEYLKTLPPGGFYLHFLPFLQGMLYVGNTAELNDEQINLVQVVADAFSTAYARYEDFNRLEAAKQQIENTLTDLRQTQQQLVQSEKMASLGELTAGIAHEIQNPLNFVNNFSEVSSELLEEMKEELATGNRQQAIEIVENVKQNLGKILHHGKRADAIVKGMLQHSRTSTGQKELTDINALADEYLRLAYHGLRAKDKTFNAKFEIELDKTIGKINVVPQEIGRVILNLINNAFYTVTEKKKHLNGTYEPTVLVSTRRLEDKVEIKVKDNGNGIPQKVMEKIFQPFFTTKPTGQGTGLGLSLSYDIITKGHGGQLKVETTEGKGSEFIIQLPLF